MKQCEHGYNCSDCSKVIDILIYINIYGFYSLSNQFYEAAGHGFAPATPQWNSQNKLFMSSTNKGSRHRDRWERRPSPPGFWRSDFPNTQETEDEKRALEQYRNKEAEKRFEQAIVSGKYLFRDQNIRHHLTKL